MGGVWNAGGAAIDGAPQLERADRTGPGRSGQVRAGPDLPTNQERPSADTDAH